MSREENIAIFEETEKHCDQELHLRHAILRSVQNSLLLFPEDKIQPGERNKEGRVVVSKQRTLEAAYSHREEGKKVAALNFASAFHPGGGVKFGSAAQEECCCRATTLYNVISNPFFSKFYRKDKDPIRADDSLIYSPGIIALRKDGNYPEMLPKEERYSLDFITCAAPNNSSGQLFEEEQYRLQYRRFSRICDAASSQGAEILILGAFGSGAFHLDPPVVAQALRDVLREKRNYFSLVDVAIYDGPTSNNYFVFNKILESL